MAAQAKMEAKLAKELRAKLAELGGRAFADDDILYHKEKSIILPENMSLRDAEIFMSRKREEMEEITQFVRVFHFRPWDGAYCTYQALKKTFGGVLHKGSSGFFATPPALISIETDFDHTEQIPWGELQVPMLPDATIHLHSTFDDEYGPVFAITANAPKKYQFEIEGIFRLVEEELRQHSIYKGKAIDGKDQPSFLNKNAVDPEKVVYTEVVAKLMNANVYSLIRYSQSFRENDVPLKRSVLLHGPYGTGKTLAGFLIAQEATKHGWGFIYVRPSKDNVFTALQTARMYSPCVVFFEDVDTIANPEDMQSDDVSRLLDEFDGIIAKGSEVIVVMTTNHPKRLHKGMLRPGRLDSMIEISFLEDNDVSRLCQQVLPAGIIAPGIDWDAVSREMKGFTPAFVKEAADRAFRSGLSENGGRIETLKLETLDFCVSAKSLQAQLEMMKEAPEIEKPDALSLALRRELARPLARFSDEQGWEQIDPETLVRGN